MLILLPPSETKRSGGDAPFDAASLAFADALTEARGRIRRGLEELSRDEEAAARALKLGVKNRHELRRNLELEVSGGLPAMDRYTGVLYDHLDAASLDAEARAWLGDHAAVQSALFGVISARDRIPAYRLSAGSRLPGIGSSLKAVWRAAHAEVDWREAGFVLDLRSKDYAELAPVPGDAGVTLHVAQRGADGAVRALNHFNKAAKGDLVRRLALARPDSIDGPGSLADWGRAAGLELSWSASEERLTLLTELGAPKAAAPA
ncbi:peroxide stress protein YaaA [Leucobacter sp. CSA1]|uniref:Peroxide stress protein YaaA n=1 Tax=Leucobacter chromiisoli TaxID=2796471 RepID=A0A934Q6U6_9MICO|nr:peroxide stress protein YaaA [Leucobacter chromiisoli]MBK0418450.1 peroxide stress protein YaaA [Leucobacter chromiisoli]